MNSGNDKFGDRLSADEHAVLDHVSGLTSTLPSPEGYPCNDRQNVGELMEQREQLQSLPIIAPEMKLTFDDLLRRIADDPFAAAALERPHSHTAQPTTAKPFFWLSSKWGIGFISISCLMLTLLTGWLVTQA
ncbi:hypothetical protein OAU50_02395 [Planctomycetota bacterium]|nr:hypothetical protein [Planctomycetota bacterium]